MHNTTVPAARTRGRLWLSILPGLVLGAIVASIAACGSGDQTLDAIDPQAVVANPTYDQVFAIIHNNCNTCHTGSGEGEEGDAPQGVALADDVPGFETCTAIVAQRFDIFEKIEDNTMPPGALPRLTSEQRLTIQRWIENGAPAPCNQVP
ncbi:MAG TPA: hypothetical protein VF247_05515 [Candidatus Krumholzibacteria bacterium]